MTGPVGIGAFGFDLPRQIVRMERDEQAEEFVAEFLFDNLGVAQKLFLVALFAGQNYYNAVVRKVGSEEAIESGADDIHALLVHRQENNMIDSLPIVGQPKFLRPINRRRVAEFPPRDIEIKNKISDAEKPKKIKNNNKINHPQGADKRQENSQKKSGPNRDARKHFV